MRSRKRSVTARSTRSHIRRIWRLRPSISTKRRRCSPARVTLAGRSWRPSSARPWRNRASFCSVIGPATRTRYSLSSRESGPISALARAPSSDSSSRPWESWSSRPSGARLRVAVRDGRALAAQGLGGEEPHRGDLVALRLARDYADRLVQHRGQAGRQFALGRVVQHQGLAGLDLAASVVDARAIDEHQAAADQILRLAPRTDAALRQPAVHSLGFGFVIAAGPGHGRL